MFLWCQAGAPFDEAVARTQAGDPILNVFMVAAFEESIDVDSPHKAIWRFTKERPALGSAGGLSRVAMRSERFAIFTKNLLAPTKDAFSGWL